MQDIRRERKRERERKGKKVLEIETYSIPTTKPTERKKVTVGNFYESFITGNVVQLW